MSLSLEVGAEAVPGYRLVRELGKGGFGTVWEAEAPGGVRVALKFIRLDTAQAGPELRALEVIRNIRHPHLLDIQFAVRREDYLVIAMPLCDRSLWDRLCECRGKDRPGGLPPGELRGYMDELARAVDFLNEPRHPAGDGTLVGVQHRDIKPQNIFLVGGSVRLADFGLAKILQGSVADHSGGLSPNYVAPEMLEGEVSQRTDQYSLAVTYYQLRCGRLPFTGSINEIVFGHLSRPPDLRGLPEDERAVLARALAKRPDDRWPSCREFVRHLPPATQLDIGPTPLAAGAEAMASTVAPRRIDLGRDTAGATYAITGPRDTLAPISRSAQATAPEPAADEPSCPRQARSPRIRAYVATGSGLVALVAMLGLFGSHRIRSVRPATPTTAPVRSALRTAPIPTAPGEPSRPPSPPRPVAPEIIPSEPPPVKPLALAAASRPADSEPKLAEAAYAILNRYCHRCHGVRFEVPGYNVLDRDVLVAKRGEGESPYIVPGKPDESELWVRLGVEKDMPPSGPRPSDSDRELIRSWITAGAPFPVADAAARPVKKERDVLAAIRAHLDRARPEDRAHLRYFSMANLHSNPTVRDDELRLARAALAKLVNSLSWKPDVIVPEAVDREQTVFAIDLREVGWDERDLWTEILAQYPYGLKHDKDKSPDDRALAEDVYEKSGSSLPFVRADWFIATASRPPLYHTILDLPKQARDLERMLKVDVEADFLHDKLARAGFAESGVSSHNRLVDRHTASYGAYWKSYDFRRSEGTGNLFRFPLGPAFADNPFPNQAFEHAGGEVIFNLPNGLQGYLLVDAKGDRIDVGPIDIVGDDDKTSGTAAVVNGLSCMACHRNGMQPFKDTVRDGLAVSGEARAKAQRLFAPKETMDRLLSKDEARFLAAVDQAAGSFLKVGDDRKKAIGDFAEPIGFVARAYLKDLDAADAAAELGLKDPNELSVLIRANARLRQLGLGPLQDGGTIKRSEWDSLERRFLSTFHQAAHELELGTPFRAF